MDNGTALAFALQYALRGWPVFPVKVWWDDRESKWRKTPLIKEWPTAASCDPDQVRAWFSRTDIEVSIGCITGPSTFYVADVDPRNGGTTEGLPTTLVSRTKSNGSHHLYKSSKVVRNGKLRDGVDFRGVGGFVVLPGSPGYEWQTDPETPMAELADWMALRATQTAKDGKGARFLEVDDIERYSAHVLAEVVEEVEQAREGERNNTLNAGAFRLGRFVGGGYLDEHEVAEALEDAADTAGLGHQEAIATIQSGLDSGKKTRITLVLPGENPEPGDEPDLDEVDQDVAPIADQVSVDHRERKIQAAAEKLRIADAARRLVKQEQAEQGWHAPIAGVESGFHSELSKLPREHAQHMVYELCGMKHNVVLAAQYKTGKTTLGLNFVRSVLTEDPFLDRQVNFPSDYSVAWFNGEMEKEDFEDYAEPIGIPGNRFAVMHLRGRRLPILNDHVADWVIKWLVEHNVKCWGVDSWRRLCAWSGVPENSNEDVERLTEQIDYIKKEAGVLSFLALAHTGRGRAEEGEEHARGATALDDWVDARWIMTKKDGTRYMYAEGRKVHMDETALAYDATTNLISLGSGSRKTVDTSSSRPIVLGLVEQKPGQSGNQIEIDLDGTLSQKVVRATLNDLKQANLIHVQPGPKNSKLHFPGPRAEFVTRSTS